MIVIDALEYPASASQPVDLPIELRALRDCGSASGELERLLGVPVVTQTTVAAHVVAGSEVRDRVGELLTLSRGEAVLIRAVRLVPLSDQASQIPVGYCRLWLAVERVPDSVSRYLLGTNLTLGQTLRLVGLPVSTRCEAWSALTADRGLTTLFDCPPGTTVLRRRMLVHVDAGPIAVTDETFCAVWRLVRRRDRGRLAVDPPQLAYGETSGS
jgi:chorismate-pyruvate lyase